MRGTSDFSVLRLLLALRFMCINLKLKFNRVIISSKKKVNRVTKRTGTQSERDVCIKRTHHKEKTKERVIIVVRTGIICHGSWKVKPQEKKKGQSSVVPLTVM